MTNNVVNLKAIEYLIIMLIKFFLFIVLFFALSCGKEKKTLKHNSEEKLKMDEKSEIQGIPHSENLLEHPDIYNLSQIPHSFSKSIVFNEVNIIKTDKNIYTMIFVIDDLETDLEELRQWKVGIYFIAKDFEKFSNETERKNKFKSQGLMAIPTYMGNEVVVFIENLNLEPKNYSLIRIHLYKNNDIINKNYYNISDVVLP